MNQKVIALLMIVTALSWLTTNECKAQKLTEVSASFGNTNDGNGVPNWYWDINGDGTLERLMRINSEVFGWVDANGNTIEEIQGLDAYPSDICIMDDFNGDGIVDFVGHTFGYDENEIWRTPICIYLSNVTNYEKVITEIDYGAFVSPCVVDINHDGRKDIFFYRESGGSYTPSALIQTKDHRF